MYNSSLFEAMKNTTAEEKEQFDLLIAYLRTQRDTTRRDTVRRDTTANHMINLHFGKVITAHYSHLLHTEPAFKKFIIEQGK